MSIDKDLQQAVAEAIYYHMFPDRPDTFYDDEWLYTRYYDCAGKAIEAYEAAKASEPASIDKKAAEAVFQQFKYVKPRLNRAAIALLCEAYEAAKASGHTQDTHSIEHVATDQPVDCASSMELLKLFGYINAMICYCQSLRVGTVITGEYMKRMSDHYIPNVQQACLLIASLVDKTQSPKPEPAQPVDCRVIFLTKGQFALVDADDYDALSKHKWHINNSGYARRDVCNSQEKTHYFIHREVMNCPKDMQVDHVNGNRLDNRKANLRFCTAAGNARARHTSRLSSSKYKGVHWYKKTGKWRAKIEFAGSDISLGLHDTEAQAALAYNEAALKYFGEFAVINEVQNG